MLTENVDLMNVLTGEGLHTVVQKRSTLLLTIAAVLLGVF